MVVGFCCGHHVVLGRQGERSLQHDPSCLRSAETQKRLVRVRAVRDQRRVRARALSQSPDEASAHDAAEQLAEVVVILRALQCNALFGNASVASLLG